MEKCMQSVMATFDRSSRGSIPIEVLARAMVANALDKSKTTKVETLENREIADMGKSATTA